MRRTKIERRNRGQRARKGQPCPTCRRRMRRREGAKCHAVACVEAQDNAARAAA